MEPRVKTLSVIAGLAVLAGVVLVALSQVRRGAGPTARQVERAANNLARDENAPIAAGATAAPFELSDLSGQTVSLAALRGKVIFLNVWATWCAPCREEMPSMEKLYERLRGQKGFVMLAVSQDTAGPAVVAKYVKRHGYHFDVLLDPQNAVAEAYDVSGVPETFIIDRNGRIVAHHSGAFDWSQPEVTDALEELLKDNKG